MSKTGDVFATAGVDRRVRERTDRMRLRALLERGPARVLDAEDESWLLDLVRARHPCPAIADQVDHVEAQRIPHQPPGLVLVFQDDRRYRLSLRRMLGETPRALVYQACREAVEPFVRAFGDSWWDGRTTATCPVTGFPMTRAGSHVDHCQPWLFVRIFDDFLDAEGIATVRPLRPAAFGAPACESPLPWESAVEQRPDRDGPRFTLDADGRSLRLAFVALHSERALFRVVHPHANRVVLPAQDRHETLGIDPELDALG